MKHSPPWFRRLVLALLALALLIALGFVMLRSGPLAPVRVTTQAVGSGSLKPALFGIGIVEARRSVLVGPTAAARVLHVAVDVGDRVQAGQLLAELDPVDLQQRLAALEASQARAVSAVAAAQAMRQDAQARRELAATNARRYRELGEQSFISTGGVEAKLQELASADAALAAAEANLAAARQDRERLGAEREALRRQGANLRLVATMDALVVSREAEPGSTVVAGQAVLRLIDPASLWIKTRFDQGRSAGLAVGLPASIALRSRPGQALAGQVARVEAVSDSVTEERMAQVSFDALPAALAVGELAEVTLALPASAKTLLLPNAAIKRVAGRVGAWRIEAGALAFAPLRLGQSGLDGQVQVLEGLQEGDRVVVYSEKELGARSRITVVDSLAGLKK